MIDREPFSPDERSLWARSVDAGGRPGACPALLDLAAYVDGRVTGAERAAIESHLADCADCLRAVGETVSRRRDDAGALPFVSPAAIAAAKALVRKHERHVARRADGTHPGFWPTSRRWGLAAAAVLVVCSLGYLSGTSAFADESAPTIDLVGEMTFGLIGTGAESDPELELFTASVVFPEQEAER